MALTTLSAPGTIRNLDRTETENQIPKESRKSRRSKTGRRSDLIAGVRCTCFRRVLFEEKPRERLRRWLRFVIVHFITLDVGFVLVIHIFRAEAERDVADWVRFFSSGPGRLASFGNSSVP